MNDPNRTFIDEGRDRQNAAMHERLGARLHLHGRLLLRAESGTQGPLPLHLRINTDYFNQGEAGLMGYVGQDADGGFICRKETKARAASSTQPKTDSSSPPAEVRSGE